MHVAPQHGHGPAPLPGRALRDLGVVVCLAAPLLLIPSCLAAQAPAHHADHADRLARSDRAEPGGGGGRARKSKPGSGIVSVEWLAAHLHDSDLVLLHVGDENEYRAAHLPGARYLSFHDLALNPHGSDPGLTLELLPADQVRAKLEALGISDRSTIVLYYGKDWITPATRVLFTLDAVGLGAFASLLDGGMPEWVRAGHPVTADVPPPPAPGHITPQSTRPVVVDAEWVQAHERSPGTVIVDARSGVYYDGAEPSGGARGHIPGARSIPFTSLVDDSLRMKSPAQLQALFSEAGVGPRDTVAAYCHIGMQATAVVFAARLLGHPAVLYDGSMQDWARRKLPLATGTTTASGVRP